MTRVYASMACGNLLVLAGAMLLGYWAKDQRTINIHVALALFAAVLTCLVHVITFTYMIVIGKLTRQAVELGTREREPRRKLDRLKSGIALGLALGTISTIVAVATGATTLRSSDWSLLHQGAAWLAMIINAVVFYLGLDRVHQAGQISAAAFERYNQTKEATQSQTISATQTPAEPRAISR